VVLGDLQLLIVEECFHPLAEARRQRNEYQNILDSLQVALADKGSLHGL